MQKFISKIFLSLLLLCNCFCFGQVNLVQNPSFEDTINCPNNIGQINRAFGWSNYGDTPEYFNSCSPTTYSLGYSGESVPYNFAGYQKAATGNAYSGFTAFGGAYASSPNFREYVGGNLTSPLIIGTKYFVSIMVSVCINPTTLNVASNNLGVSFSTIAYSWPNYYPITNNPKINTPLRVTDSLNWTRISGSFIADSSFSHVIIGNFFDDAHTDTLILDGSNQYKYAYYYLDDVCVSTDSLLCNSPSGIIPNDNGSKINISPNPFSESTKIKISKSANSDDLKLELLNVLGKKEEAEFVYDNSLSSPEIILRKNNLSGGIYFLRIFVSGEMYVKKIVVE